jgi:hypothetical protein
MKHERAIYDHLSPRQKTFFSFFLTNAQSFSTPFPFSLHVPLLSAPENILRILRSTLTPYDPPVQLGLPRNAPAGRAPLVSASPHLAGRRLAQGRFRNPAPRPVASAVPSSQAASRLGQLDRAPSRPPRGWSVLPLAPSRARARRTHPSGASIRCGSIRPDDSDPHSRPSRPVSVSLSTPATGQGAVRRRRPRRRRRRIVPLAPASASPAATRQVSLGSPSLCISRGDGCATRVQWRHRRRVLAWTRARSPPVFEWRMRR